MNCRVTPPLTIGLSSLLMGEVPGETLWRIPSSCATLCRAPNSQATLSWYTPGVCAERDMLSIVKLLHPATGLAFSLRYGYRVKEYRSPTNG